MSGAAAGRTWSGSPAMTAVLLLVIGAQLAALGKLLSPTEGHLASRAFNAGGLRGGEILPEATLPDLMGKQRSLRALLDGKGNVLCFVSSTCDGCEEQVLALARLCDEQGANGMRLVFVHCGSLKDARRYWKGLPRNYPVLIDARHDAFKAYRVAQFPHTVFAGRELRCEYVLRGWAASAGPERRAVRHLLGAGGGEPSRERRQGMHGGT